MQWFSRESVFVGMGLVMLTAFLAHTFGRRKGNPKLEDILGCVIIALNLYVAVGLGQGDFPFALRIIQIFFYGFALMTFLRIVLLRTGRG